MGSPQIVTAKTGSGQRAQALQPTLAMQPILKPPVPTSTSYAESSVDSVVSSTCIGNPTSGRRRAPPPPPPRTSSRSPLASPLRTNHKFNPRPLPSLPATVENNHFTMPLVTTVTSVLPQSQTRSASILSADSKVAKTNKGRLPVPTQTKEKLVESHDVLLRYKCASSANSSLSRRTSEADINNMITTCASDSGAPLTLPGSPKRDTLESRHQELLKTQKHLQEQYDRLQRFHGTQDMSVPSVNEKLQFIVPPSPQCMVQVVSEANATPERQLHLQTDTDRINKNN
ncbi:hypothetical protein DAPPUDRAFT_116598 [Daphnia pulex]|uniref:Uncharacterized protein n=1 Tax=Daphnia pulex TaxID=6669 RepID=E9HPV2_DAPPU|nr:hypothetical protein DAPPUDRAFT_116598 [Daphnia pulex]|eukprot:EFX66224.1 hypothetical protein DAPPUDRAFT_116598 [Daphnia pulex]